MPEMGEKFVCGGREFWCVGFDMQSKKAVMHSGTAVVRTPLSSFDKTFKKVDSLEVGRTYVAKNTYGDIEAGMEYGVESIVGDHVTLSNNTTLSLPIFASLF